MQKGKQQTIVHPGIVESITQKNILVKILAQSACAACHVKSACNMSEMEEKSIEVAVPPKNNYRIGEQVNIEMKLSSGRRAIMLGYLYPLILLVFTMVLITVSGGSEGVAGLSAILVLLPYYLIIYLLRDKIRQGFVFTIKKM